jgi:hypothetical protein
MDHMGGGGRAHHIHGNNGVGNESFKRVAQAMRHTKEYSKNPLALDKKHVNHSEKMWKVLLYCFAVCLGYILLGYCFFGLKYGWSFIDCLYFAMVTVTTVGYGDLLPATTFGDQLFTGIYAFMGVGFIGFVIKELTMLFAEMLKEIEKALQKETVRAANHLIRQASSKTCNQTDQSSVREVGKKLQAMMAASKEQQETRGTVAWYLRGLAICTGSVIACWAVGGIILVLTEGFRFTDSFYCAAITSLSVGYGDFYPSSQEGRLCYALYIPLSVVWILSCIGRLTMMLSEMQTTREVTELPLASMMSMDTDGSGKISKEEYVIFMLIAMREIDKDLLNTLAGQFDLLDTDSSRTLELEDFPPGLALQRTVHYASGIISQVTLDVVPEKMKGHNKKAKDAAVAKILGDYRTHRKADASVRNLCEEVQTVVSFNRNIKHHHYQESSTSSPTIAPSSEEQQDPPSEGPCGHSGHSGSINLMQADLGALQEGDGHRIFV